MKIDVSHIAKLANLPLSPTEKTKFEKQLEETLEHVENLNEVEVRNIEPTSQVTGLENVTREDIETGCEITQEEALSNAKSTNKGFIKVKAILEE